MLNNIAPTFFLISVLVLNGCTLQNAPIESVNSQHSNVEYYILPGLDHGLVQSPINILSTETHAPDKHQVTLHFQDKINAIENLGHTVQLDFEEGSTINSDGMNYRFKQMHFHTPSEHLIDGMTFPMELHLVNHIPPANLSDTPHFLVIAVLFKMGKENQFISEFWDKIPKQVHTKTALKNRNVKLHDLFSHDLGQELNDFYHYEGSLTTPPYTESVNWYVLKHIVEASPEQIRAINKIEGNNARHMRQNN